jgi:hypothetical protein
VTRRPRIVTKGGQPDKNVAITATVLPRPDSTYPIVVRPYKLDISQFGEKVRDRMKFTIANVSDKEVEVRLVAGASKYAEISLPKKIGAGQSGSGEVVLLSDVLDKSFEKSFTFEVKAETPVRFTVPIKRSMKRLETDTTKQSASTSSAGH